MRDIVFAVIMLSLPASVAFIMGKTFLSVSGETGRAYALAPEEDPAAAMFRARCAHCHGDLAEGTQAGPALTDRDHARDRMSDAAMRTAIRYGIDAPRGGYTPMPGFPGLGEAELTRLIRFLRARQEMAREG